MAATTSTATNPTATGSTTTGHATAHQTHQQHPIKLYLVVWGWLFVLSFFSYLVEYYDVQGAMRWTLVLFFMMLKAGLIVAVFMHMAWERLTLVYAVLTPPLAVLVLVAIMQLESTYTYLTRALFFIGGLID